MPHNASASSTQITLAHLIPAPFVQQVGRALYEEGMLACLATTFVKQPEAKWQQILCQLAKAVKFDLAKQISRREISEIPLSLVKDHPWKDLTRLLVSRIDRQKILTDRVFHWELMNFDRWVAEHNLTNSNVVYGYEYGCLATFQTAKKLGIATIYEVPSPEHDFVENLIHQELVNYPELNTAYYRYTRKRQEARTQRRRQEWQLADVVITNSEFTKRSYATAGLNVDKVRVIPLGSPAIFPEGIEGVRQSNEPVVFLWAGTFSIRKGAHYLLKAWKQLASKHKDQAILKIFGAMGLPDSELQNLPDNICISPTVSRSQLYKYYQQADMLIFPTLCDGFGMVVTEALAQGLPVITTEQAGAADWLIDGENGLIVPAGDFKALMETLTWCITHPQKLKAMRPKALQTAANWQWSDYRQALVKNVREGLSMAGYEV